MRRLPAPVWALAAAKVAFHLATTRLGFHRDELYFIAASRRLAWSYVDFQPLTPLLVRAERAVFGETLLGMRLVPALAGALSIVLAALIARELGGGRRAQVTSAIFLAVVPLFVGMNSALNTVSLETPAWMLVAWLASRLLRTRDDRLWVAVGAAAGLALLVKFTMLAYLGGLGVALLASPLRRDLRRPWPWVGAGVAAALVAPSLAWQVANGLPALEFVSNQGGGGAVLGLRGRLGYLAGLLVLPGIVPIVVWAPGLVALVRDWAFRALGIAHAVALAGFLVAAGKGYYAAPAIAVLLCAGSVRLLRERGRYPRGLISATAGVTVATILLLVPVVPVSLLRSNADVADATEMGERIGWQDLARDVRRIAGELPGAERDRAVVLGSNYTLAAAIEHYGGPPAVSGHNSAYLWWPDLPDDHVAIAIGFDRSFLKELYGEVVRAGTVRNDEGVDNYEWGKPIFVARDPLVSPAVLRERARIFTA